MTAMNSGMPACSACFPNGLAGAPAGAFLDEREIVAESRLGDRFGGFVAGGTRFVPVANFRGRFC